MSLSNSVCFGVSAYMTWLCIVSWVSGSEQACINVFLKIQFNLFVLPFSSFSFQTVSLIVAFPLRKFLPNKQLIKSGLRFC